MYSHWLRANLQLFVFGHRQNKYRIRHAQELRSEWSFRAARDLVGVRAVKVRVRVIKVRVMAVKVGVRAGKVRDTAVKVRVRAVKVRVWRLRSG